MNVTNQILADFEQLETEITATAGAISAYYHTLRKNKLPPPLSETLTIEFARQWWTEQLGLNEQHVYMHNDMDEGDE